MEKDVNKLFVDFLNSGFLTNNEAKIKFMSLVGDNFIKQNVILSLKGLKVFRRNIDDLKNSESYYAKAILCYLDKFISILEDNCEKSFLS